MTVAHDIRHGLRALGRAPTVTAVALLALVLGIGANTAIFSVVYATLLEPLRYRDPDQLVMVWSQSQGRRSRTSPGDYLEWMRRNAVFQGVHAWSGRDVTVSLTDGADMVYGVYITPGFYSMTGVPLQLGRDFRPEEGEPGNDRVVILSNRFWRERFGGDPNVVGRDIRIEREPHTVVGVLAPGDADRSMHPIALPLAFEPDDVTHDARWLFVMGRLRTDVSLRQANDRMNALAAELAESHPDTNQGWTVSVEPLQNNFLSGQTIRALWLLLGAVGFILLIACVNVANLLLARGTSRQREIAVRAALGASRGRIVGQLLTESVLLASLGGILGVALAAGLLKVVLALIPPNMLPIEADIRLSLPVLAFTAVVAVASGVVFGSAPAWQAARVELNAIMKDEASSSLGGGQRRLQRALVVAEIALALTLLAGGGLAVSSFARLTNAELGFRRENILTFWLPVPAERLPTNERTLLFYRDLLDEARALPGVTSVAASTGVPVRGVRFGTRFQVAGEPVGEASSRPGAGVNMVTPDYFRTFGIAIDRGRTFTEDDVANRQRVAIVNELLVREHLPADVDPLTQRVVFEEIRPGGSRGQAQEWQIVGVYRGVLNGGPRGDFPEIDVPFWQSPWPQAQISVHTVGDPGGVRQTLAGLIRALDPDLPMAEVRTMDQMVDETVAGDRFRAVLFGSFALVALALATMGVYGTMSFAVAQRTREIGVRVALGATRRRVLREVLREGIGTTLLGVAIGSLGGYGVGRAMQGMWFGVTGSVEPLTVLVAWSAVLLAALLACVVPARRAAAVDPMAALRQE